MQISYKMTYRTGLIDKCNNRLEILYFRFLFEIFLMDFAIAFFLSESYFTCGHIHGARLFTHWHFRLYNFFGFLVPFLFKLITYTKILIYRILQ